ncbi:unnamed protein product [Didymodactylos carnosus]|uniref:EF-hand domain-containing protein n=1 Tax=Didymodactylos carnosus TaxID=1234261 RepID=A0A813WDF7_9BILA|nr:unnamed protein product [Didymodactylos carnosus]CAF0868186.1 unnamed protein product [Didymodactylos carnosus]CAF3641393.1 unnamed protein product [Didymodactylos carnosus]CAF3652981.1 unnamed protein product [Didymodactylos carnosus]
MSAKTLSDERINELREIFSMLDDGGGYLNQTQLGTLLLAMGFSIPNIEISALMNKFDTEKTGKIDFPQVLTIIATQTNNLTSAGHSKQILEAMKLFDTNNDGTNFISLLMLFENFSLFIDTILESDFRFLMTQMGEPLTKQSYEDMINSTDARTKNGRINYRKLTSAIIHL